MPDTEALLTTLEWFAAALTDSYASGDVLHMLVEGGTAEPPGSRYVPGPQELAGRGDQHEPGRASYLVAVGGLPAVNRELIPQR